MVDNNVNVLRGQSAKNLFWLGAQPCKMQLSRLRNMAYACEDVNEQILFDESNYG